MILSFFASSDVLVTTNLVSNFLSEITVPEMQVFLQYQCMIENIHTETYGTLLETYVQDAFERSKLFRAIETIPSIKRKAEFALKYANRENASFAERVISYAAFEGIMFSSSFAAIFYFKKRGKSLNGLQFANELISRDEALHMNFSCLIYDKLANKLPVSRVHEILIEATDLEKEFTSRALPCSLIGMNSKEMCKYVEFVCDCLAYKLTGQKIYNVENPFDFMTLLSCQSKTNFFEKRVSEYSLSKVRTSNDTGLNVFSLDEDF